jgi:hypothetical protein
MKPGNIFKTQMSLLLFIVFPLITGMCSCNKDLTYDIDITEFQWELQIIYNNEIKHEKPSGDFHRDNAYVLWFSSDSTFMLNTSANYAGGKYRIISKGSIEIINYGIMTLACCETDFDEKMIDVFKKMTSYTVKGNTLNFKGDNSEVEFKQR